MLNSSWRETPTAHKTKIINKILLLMSQVYLRGSVLWVQNQQHTIKLGYFFISFLQNIHLRILCKNSAFLYTSGSLLIFILWYTLQALKIVGPTEKNDVNIFHKVAYFTYR